MEIPSIRKHSFSLLILFLANSFAQKTLSPTIALREDNDHDGSSSHSPHRRLAKTTIRPAKDAREKPSLPVFSYGSASLVGREEEWPNANGTEELSDARSQMLAGLPDLSDPCFRRYANSIIVNAQPFERRSSISLVHCKVSCLRSQLGVYSCRSFVYDNLNQVCDLFAHVGDQSPAKLLRFKTRDYFEPTAAIHCQAQLEGNEQTIIKPAMGVAVAVPTTNLGSALPSTLFPLPTAAAPTTTPFPIIFPSSSSSTSSTSTRQMGAASTPTPAEEDEQNETEQPPYEPSPPGEELRAQGTRSHDGTEWRDERGGQGGCEQTQVPRYLRTVDFELYGFDDVKLSGKSVEECAHLCSFPSVSPPFPRHFKCNSFEYSPLSGECAFTAEVAVPLGNGQLRQRSGTDYLERICVEQRLVHDCASPVFRRFPQMILVGFAETVVDASSLQQCFDNCLNSRHLYGFNCTSGMFYFEEPQLNCILNTEDRTSQPDLFTAETSDLVDYFETGCSAYHTAKSHGNELKRSMGELAVNEYRKRDFVEREQNGERRGLLGWTEWTECSGAGGQWSTVGTRMRWKMCAKGRHCGREQAQCLLTKRGAGETGGSRATVAPQLLRGTGSVTRRCRSGECCPLLGSCRLGILFSKGGTAVQWCRDPCGEKKVAGGK